MLANAFEHYKTGLPEMDKSHWELFQALNQMTCTLSRLELLELASKINQMWVDHHFNEEALMDKLGYPYAAAHKEVHVLITEQFQQFRNKFENEHKYTNDFFKSDLEILLREHIDHMDTQYAVWSKKIGYQG